MVLTFSPRNETLLCEYSNESYRAVLRCGDVVLYSFWKGHFIWTGFSRRWEIVVISLVEGNRSNNQVISSKWLFSLTSLKVTYSYLLRCLWEMLIPAVAPGHQTCTRLNTYMYLVAFTTRCEMFFPLFLQCIICTLHFVSFTLCKLKLFLVIL